MRVILRQETANIRRQRLVVGGLLFAITIVGIVAFTNWFSFLMLILLGVPGLLVLLDGIFDQ